MSAASTETAYHEAPAGSIVSGLGWGSDHDWRFSEQVGRSTIYRCTACGVLFAHYYPSTPQIFKAMHQAGISNKCPNRTDATQESK